MVKYAVNESLKESKSGALSKLLIALKFYNSYCEVGVPIVTREELLQAESGSMGGYPRVTKFFKYTEASWPGNENLAEFSWVDSDGTINIRSTDDE